MDIIFSLQGVTSFLEQCRLDANPKIVATTPMLTRPGGELVHVLAGHTENLTHADITQDGTTVITGYFFV